MPPTALLQDGKAACVYVSSFPCSSIYDLYPAKAGLLNTTTLQRRRPTSAILSEQASVAAAPPCHREPSLLQVGCGPRCRPAVRRSRFCVEQFGRTPQATAVRHSLRRSGGRIDEAGAWLFDEANAAEILEVENAARQAEPLREGCVARVRCHRGAVHLNGLRVTLRTYDEEKQRWMVETDEGAIKAILPRNLEPQPDGDSTVKATVEAEPKNLQGSKPGEEAFVAEGNVTAEPGLGKDVKSLQEQEMAATRIQARHRGNKVRSGAIAKQGSKVAEDQPVEEGHGTADPGSGEAGKVMQEQEVAATRIQARHRGNRVRAGAIAKQGSAASEDQPVAEGHGAAEASRGEAGKTLQQQETAATRIQARHRGNKARAGAIAKQASRAPADEFAAEGHVETSAPVSGEGRALHEREAAATRIQARHRGNRARAGAIAKQGQVADTKFVRQALAAKLSEALATGDLERAIAKERRRRAVEATMDQDDQRAALMLCISEMESRLAKMEGRISAQAGSADGKEIGPIGEHEVRDPIDKHEARGPSDEHEVEAIIEGKDTPGLVDTVLEAHGLLEVPLPSRLKLTVASASGLWRSDIREGCPLNPYVTVHLMQDRPLDMFAHTAGQQSPMVCQTLVVNGTSAPVWDYTVTFPYSASEQDYFVVKVWNHGQKDALDELLGVVALRLADFRSSGKQLAEFTLDVPPELTRKHADASANFAAPTISFRIEVEQPAETGEGHSSPRCDFGTSSFNRVIFAPRRGGCVKSPIDNMLKAKGVCAVCARGLGRLKDEFVWVFSCPKCGRSICKDHNYSCGYCKRNACNECNAKYKVVHRYYSSIWRCDRCDTTTRSMRLGYKPR